MRCVKAALREILGPTRHSLSLEKARRQGKLGKLHGDLVLGAGLEPASLSAYAPQTYVSASSTTRASRGSKLSAGENSWQVSSVFFLLMLVIVILLKTQAENEIPAIRE